MWKFSLLWDYWPFTADVFPPTVLNQAKSLELWQLEKYFFFTSNFVFFIMWVQIAKMVWEVSGSQSTFYKSQLV